MSLPTQVSVITAEVISAADIPADVRPRIPPGTGPALGAYRSRTVLPGDAGTSVDYQARADRACACACWR